MRSKQTSQLHTPVFSQWVRSEIDDKIKLPFLLNELTVCIRALVPTVITHKLPEQCIEKFPDLRSFSMSIRS
jgi:hypothetical protein